MKKRKYYIRLDDACPFMDKTKWDKILNILTDQNIKVLIGVIPDNKDELTIKNQYSKSFWQTVREWENKGHVIALHGYDHCYLTHSGGINPIHNRSEFAGVDFDIQKKKIKDGYDILKKQGLNPVVFYAPSHTFDENTIKALLEETPIRIISDTIAFKPYQFHGIIFHPQQIGQFRNIPFAGLFTFCFHPNNMDEKDFERFERFLMENRQKFHNYGELLNKTADKNRNYIEKLLQQAYYFLHRIKR